MMFPSGYQHHYYTNKPNTKLTLLFLSFLTRAWSGASPIFLSSVLTFSPLVFSNTATKHYMC